MSVFRVKLNNAAQGLMDVDGDGLQRSTSYQRTVYVTGPNKVNRMLKDGDTFTDSNYWKRFAYPQVSLADAFIEVVTDDGSTWSDVVEENTYPVVWLPGDNGIIPATETYTDDNMELDIVTDYGSPAVFASIQNSDSSDSVKIRLNGSSTAIFTLEAGQTQVFDKGNLTISKIGVDNSHSGASQVDKVEVVLGIRSVSTS